MTTLPALRKNQKKSNGRGGKRPGAGRPKGALGQTHDVRALAAEHGPALIGVLVNLALKDGSGAVRIAAARELLDRGYGRSPQPIVGDEARPIVIHAIKWLQPLE